MWRRGDYSPLGKGGSRGRAPPKAEEYMSGCSGFDLEEVPGEGELQLPFPRHVCGLSSGQSRWKRW